VASETWAVDISTRGKQCRHKITGVTKDSGGAALGNCVVQLFRTSNDEFIMENTSDLLGNYEVRTPYPGANHYCVAYKQGSPDVTGATVNTLVPAA
jgi:hypothetical protein